MNNPILESSSNMYNQYDYDINSPLDHFMANNRLFCTFSNLEGIDEVVCGLKQKYDIMYNKMFILHVKSNNEYAITYNVDQGNVSSIPDNTILVHRKKETNSLYTINALNQLIKSLNGGVVDTNFIINWQHYKNCILLTQHNEIKQLNTRIYSIIEL